MGDCERNKKRLLELLQRAGTGNAHCADCGEPDPDWASYKLGIFICLNCSGVHRNFPAISKVKSVRLDFWEDSIVEFMTHNGNLRVKAKYEARVPAFYYVPQANDCLVLKEQWIRAKYERQEFMADGKTISPPGNREGFLWKRGRDNAQFLKRRFVLLAREGLLKYYTKEEGKGPKAVISIKDLNATFQTEKIGNPHGLQITYRREGHVRNLFVYHESGKEIVDWFNALRAARLQYLKMAFPELPESELVPLITRNYVKQGFMEKTGPKDAFEQGQVFIGSNEQGYDIYEDLPKGIRGNHWKAGLTIVTPQRKFVFTCPTEKEQREWLRSLRDVLYRPLTPLNHLSKTQGLGYIKREWPQPQVTHGLKSWLATGHSALLVGRRSSLLSSLAQQECPAVGNHPWSEFFKTETVAFTRRLPGPALGTLWFWYIGRHMCTPPSHLGLKYSPGLGPGLPHIQNGGMAMKTHPLYHPSSTLAKMCLF
ncbi:arf-GAP with dual PH domain-containing protein 2 isoform X3 [Loxodonta africana]|uniref:arf-GAP with dual PH domain-containing protein 2 isoform X3 n=1 Tax=Loxodonta africana TaxID=9785 RepID=UPI000C812A1C|nr:arf-GAP with dual PH domain-containing protein 2 isoform X3 [Loxodonta africana]